MAAKQIIVAILPDVKTKTGKGRPGRPKKDDIRVPEGMTQLGGPNAVGTGLPFRGAGPAKFRRRSGDFPVQVWRLSGAGLFFRRPPAPLQDAEGRFLAQILQEKTDLHRLSHSPAPAATSAQNGYSVGLERVSALDLRRYPQMKRADTAVPSTTDKREASAPKSPPVRRSGPEVVIR